MTATPGPRKATAVDLPSIQDIIAAAYGKYLGRMDRPPAPMLRDYSGAVDAGEVWVTGDPIVGLIALTPTEDSLLVENVAVHPTAQGTGLGRRLMEFADEQAASRGFKRVTLYTNEVMTENQALYTRLGYREKERQTEDGYRRVYLEKILSMPN